MKLNWTIRLRNKVWLTTFLATLIAFVFDLLSLFDVTPLLTEDAAMHFVTAALTLLSGLGVLIDPTTEGVSDSDRAMGYK